MYDMGPNCKQGLFTNKVVLAKYKILLKQSRKYNMITYVKINMQCVLCEL
jgi:hypothetical protein